jgi:membrane-bound metal-dependent hydrolase YbcI (DUF457 family)
MIDFAMPHPIVSQSKGHQPMNTPAHLIFGAAAFGKPGQPFVTLAAVLGSLAPDASLYFMVAWNRFVRGMSFEQIFSVEYFSPFWQQVFAIDNSVFVWGAILLLAFLWKSQVVIAFALAGLLHIALDFPLHHDDGRPHFWPVSDWVFNSPVSYWDGRAYGHIVSVIEMAAVALLMIYLWRRFPSIFARCAILIGGLAELVPGIMFRQL